MACYGAEEEGSFCFNFLIKITYGIAFHSSTVRNNMNTTPSLPLRPTQEPRSEGKMGRGVGRKRQPKKGGQSQPKGMANRQTSF